MENFPASLRVIFRFLSPLEYVGAVFFILGCGFDVILTFIPKGALAAPLNPVCPGFARIDANTLLKRPMFPENAVSRSETRVSVF